MKKVIFTALLALVAMTAFGQEGKNRKAEYDTRVNARVKDHLTHGRVPGVKGELLLAADSSVVDTLATEEYDGMTLLNFHLRQPGRYLMRVMAEGYVTAYVTVDAPKLHRREHYRSLPNIYLRQVPRKNERELQELVVTSTKLKFYMDGDTLVYNADAFPMAEGSMLGDLIRKLPGVELADGGVIKVDGKPVDAMLLNGKDFFDKDRELLLENMPSYLVKSFNAYERAPQKVRGTRQEKVEEQEFVMDVRLKREYNAGWIANAEAGGGATFYHNHDGRLDGRHLGRLFGLRFTDKSRLVVFANANNLNDYRNPGREGDWAQLGQSEGLTSTVRLGANYKYQQESGLPKNHDYEGSIDAAYTDYTDGSHTSSATFLDNGNTYGRSSSGSRSYNWELNTKHQLMYHQNQVGEALKHFNMHVIPSFKYQRWDNRAQSAAVTLAEDVAARLGKSWMDSIAAPNAGHLLKQYAINRTMSSSRGTGHDMNLSGNAFFLLTPLYNDRVWFSVQADGKATDRSENTYEHYRLDYPRDEAHATDDRNRYRPTTSTAQSVYVIPSMYVALEKEGDHTLTLKYNYDYQHSDDDNPLYLLNRLDGWQTDDQPLGQLPSAEEMLAALDAHNSVHAIATRHTHGPEIGYTTVSSNRKTRVTKTFITRLAMNFNNETLDYQQGQLLDTLTTRNTTLLNGGIAYYYRAPKRSRDMRVYYNFNIAAPSMVSLLDIRNDSDPLNITLGNPALRNTTTHNLGGSYRDKFGRTLVNAAATAKLQTNAVAYGFIYNRETGVRTTKPENVNGNWQAHADGGIDFPLDKHDRWRLKESVNYDYNHSVDLAGTNAAAEATRSTVGSHYLTDKLSLYYRPTSKMEFGINGNLTYQHSTSNRESFQTLNVFTYHYGANAQLELPLGLQLSTDLTMYSRRGYSEASMNTNELVWNARLAKRLMHGNLTLMFDGFDLLGNLSNVRRTINAQGRTETFYNVIPSYGLFHAIYRLNKQPKNKK